jgi:chromosome partitioning protein
MMVHKKQPMMVVTVASTKGGVSKTTLSSALAVRAAADGLKVALIDTDPQASLARWHELRGSPANPKIVEIDAAREAIALLISQKWDIVIIDTPPAFLDKVENAISLADFVLVPCRPSAVDVEAVRDVVSICNDHGKPFAFIITQILPPPGRIVEGARKYLEASGDVMSSQMTSRKPYAAAMTVGKTGPEIRGGEAAAEEIKAIWAEVSERMRKAS